MLYSFCNGILHQNPKIDEEFVAWIENLKRDALNEGVTEEVLNWALKDVTVSKDTVVNKKTAPEVKLTLDAYLKRSSSRSAPLVSLTVFNVKLISIRFI